MFEMKIGIEENIEMDLCDRIIRKKKDPTRPRTIICRLTVLKDTGIFIYEDYCKDTMRVRKKLWDQVLNYRKKIAYLNCCSIVVHNKR